MIRLGELKRVSCMEIRGGKVGVDVRLQSIPLFSMRRQHTGSDRSERLPVCSMSEIDWVTLGQSQSIEK